MGDLETRKLLNRVSGQLNGGDFQNLKHLCRDKIPFGDLERAKQPNDLFTYMFQRRLIRPGSLAFLENLLSCVGRCDLAAMIRSSGGDSSMEPESGLVTPSSMANKEFLRLLNGLSDELTRDNVDSLKFIADLPGRFSSRINLLQ